MIPSYGSPYTIGHKAIGQLFDGPVTIQEKIDGSQISFGLLEDGEVLIRSKGAKIETLAPPKMFNKAVETIVSCKDALQVGLIYRGEYLSKPKHNVLAYDRVPDNHIALFDIEDTTKGEQYFLPHNEVEAIAKTLGFSCVPCLFMGDFGYNLDGLRPYLDRVSLLGGAKIEGIVVKNYNRFTVDKKVMMGKFVSEAFKEVHAGEFRKENPTTGDIKDRIIAAYRTPARWAKAVQHLRDSGNITDSPKDIGALIKEVYVDVEKECTDEIKDILFEHFFPDIKRSVVHGLAEWYKEQLMVKTHEDETVGPGILDVGQGDTK